MSCCGNKRTAFVQQQGANQKATSPGTSRGLALPPIASKMWADLHFENTGEVAVTFRGAVTNKHYHWPGKGVVQAMDYRDAGRLGPYRKILRRVL